MGFQVPVPVGLGFEFPPGCPLLNPALILIFGRREMVAAIKVLGDGFVRMEHMKMEMAREMETMRMEMEMKRTEMILEKKKKAR
ncbi:uncharacterized protein HKW66_Vig0078340 [Vigna angularis]|uniref:Uncharacterized protein n=1 Tax=Phaseolus angularis TaxID=3914 RepID=A0A8T0K5A2_PHAAN|nr:uncharacterized protein HKW66_Vig0078340 [Vigna angularis]